MNATRFTYGTFHFMQAKNLLNHKNFCIFWPSILRDIILKSSRCGTIQIVPWLSFTWPKSAWKCHTCPSNERSFWVPGLGWVIIEIQINFKVYISAFSALDAKSEHLVQGALEHLMEGRTVITIAHRLSTIKNAHNILVLDQGKICQSGSYSILMQDKSGLFYKLIEKQTLSNSTEKVVSWIIFIYF